MEYCIETALLTSRLSTQAFALIVAAIAVTCFTAVFTILFINYRKFAVSEVESGKRDIELIELYFHGKKKSVIRGRKFLQILKTVLYTLLMAFITVCLVFTAFVRFSDKLPFGTKSLMVVATDSMSEANPLNEYLYNESLKSRYPSLSYQFPALCIIVIEKVDPQELNQYDVIAYDHHASGETIIHRIRMIERDENGNIKSFRTRSDKYTNDDQSGTEVTVPDDVIGRYTGIYVPFLGAFVMFLQSLAGVVTVIALIFCLIMFDKNSNLISVAQNDRTEYLVKALDIKDIHEDSEITVDFVEKIYLDKVGYLLKEGDTRAQLENDEPDANDDTEDVDVECDSNVDMADVDVENESVVADDELS